MWPRLIEAGLGVWLGVSPFAFGIAGSTAFWGAVAGGALIAGSSIAAWMDDRFEPARYLTLLVAAGIAAGVYFTAPRPADGFQQSAFLTALVLGMFAIIPNRCHRPPEAWMTVGDPEADRTITTSRASKPS